MKNFLASIAAVMLSLTATAQAWQKVYPDIAGSYSLASTTNGNVYAYKANNMALSTDISSASTWTPVASPAIAAGNLYAHKNVLFIIDRSGTGSKGIMRSSDLGASWQSANSGIIGIDSENLVGMESVGGNIFLYHHGSSVNKLYVSTDNGMSWSANLNMFSQSAINIVQKGSSYYLITTGTVYRSDDGGDSWNNLNVSFPTFGSKTLLLSDGTFIMRAGANIYTSTDAINWITITPTGLPAAALTRQFIKSTSGDTLYLSTEVVATSTYDLYMSPDKGATWISISNGLSANPQIADNGYSTLHIATNGYLYASPENNGVYRTAAPVSSSTVVPAGVADHEKPGTKLAIHPNPVFRDLNISFTTQETGSANLSLADILGNILMQKEIVIAAGEKNFELDVSTLAIGIYFVKVEMPHSTITGRFIKQ